MGEGLDTMPRVAELMKYRGSLKHREREWQELILPVIRMQILSNSALCLGELSFLFLLFEHL